MNRCMYHSNVHTLISTALFFSRLEILYVFDLFKSWLTTFCGTFYTSLKTKHLRNKPQPWSRKKIKNWCTDRWTDGKNKWIEKQKLWLNVYKWTDGRMESQRIIFVGGNKKRRENKKLNFRNKSIWTTQVSMATDAAGPDLSFVLSQRAEGVIWKNTQEGMSNSSCSSFRFQTSQLLVNMILQSREGSSL